MPVVLAAPASAVTNVICVLPASGAGCNSTVATVQLAITAANGNGLANTIQLGAATYSDGPYVLFGGTHAIALKGAGQASTFITLPPSATFDTYIDATAAVVSDLTVTMASVSSNGDVGVHLGNGSSATNLTVDDLVNNAAVNDAGITANLSTLTNVTVDLSPVAGSGTTAIFSAGSNTISDITLTASQAFELSDPGTTDHVTRAHLRSDNLGVVTDGGTIDIDDSVIDLGTSTGTGILAANFNGGGNNLVISADHVTIVGGTAGSRGARVAAITANASQAATLNLTNSIVRGPATSLVADAHNNGGVLAPSTATLNVGYTDYESTDVNIDPTTGSGGISFGTGNLVAVDPSFVSASDHHLTPGSPVVDKGDPAAGGPATDLDDQPRVVDGDAVAGAVRDMGAYELPDTVAPDTTIDSGPTGPTNDSTPTFTFSSGAGATFECRLDAGSFAPCVSPFTAPAPLADGPHTFDVAATDAATNTDPSPASQAFQVDTVPPTVSLLSGPSGLTTDATPTFTFTGEAGATLECRVDTATYAACASPFTTGTLTDGPHTFSVRATDAAGNQATSAASAVTVDTVAPAVTITKKPAKRTTKRKVKIAFTSEAGSSFECQVDGKAWKPCTSPLKLKVKVGKHTVLVRATDVAGNLGTPAKVKFRRVPRA